MNEEERNSELKINAFAKEVNNNAKKHGWWDKKRSFSEVVALCHCELSEAIEEDREGKPDAYFIHADTGKEETNLNLWTGEKLEGRAVELADCIIRILDWCGKNNIDIEKIITLKHNFNITRPYKHGGKKY